MRVFNRDLLSHLICAGRLFHRRDLIVGHGLQRGGKQTGTILGKTVQQLTRRFMRSDFHSGLRQNRTGIHGSHDAEHRGSGHLLARPNGTLHGSRATPLRKQREVQVVPSHRQRVEHILLQDFAIRHHCRGLGTGRSKFGNERFLARIGFNHRQTKIKSGLLHGIRYQFASTPGRSIRSGEHCDHFETLGIFSQHFQRRHRNIRSTGKQHFQHEKSSLSNPHHIVIIVGIIPAVSTACKAAERNTLCLMHRGNLHTCINQQRTQRT